MPEWMFAGLITLGVGLIGTVGAVIGSWLTRKSSKDATRAAVAEHEDQAQNRFIDQLQEELNRYRAQTDKRLDRLEKENQGYRAFIGIQRDWMAEHGTPLPPWPEGLPR